MKADKCKNCGKRPEVTLSDDMDYPWMLKHVDGGLCYPTYKLITYQQTKDECIKEWNDFNSDDA